MNNSKYGRGSIVKTSSGKWRVRIPDGKGKQTSIGCFASEERAQEARDAAIIQSADLADLSGVSLKSYGERWIEKCRRAGIRSVDSMLSRWINITSEAPFAKLSVEEISSPEIRDWAKEKLLKHPARRATMRGGKHVENKKTGYSISRQTAKHCLSDLCRCFDQAVEDGLIARNPARGIKLPREETTAELWDWLRPDEVEAIFSLNLSQEQRAVFSVAIYQGLRQGEIAALLWKNIDLDRGWMLVHGSWDKSTKSGKPRRIPILPAAIRALKQWREDAGKTSLVFPSSSGELYSVGYCWRWDERRNGVKPIPERAGIARKIRFHDLRHTCGSNLVSGSWGRAWSLEEVQVFLGHRDIATTQRYAHLNPEGLWDAARRTNAFFKENENSSIKRVTNMSRAENLN